MQDGFKFPLGVELILKVSDEKGECIGRAQYVNAENQYQLRYKDGNGCAVESWWGESALHREDTIR